eukprot:15340290-Ditylum_brightwellii.AAC.1
MVGFVDDATGQTNTFYNNGSTPEEILKLMQYNTQLWFDLLWLLGGLLELNKCSYHFINYAFLIDSTPVMVSKRAGPPLKV